LGYRRSIEVLYRASKANADHKFVEQDQASAGPVPSVTSGDGMFSTFRTED
jgi:hypothetical protein